MPYAPHAAECVAKLASPLQTAAPMSALALLALVEPLSPSVEGEELVFAADLPPDIEPLLLVLHTGVRALLSGRKWWGSTDVTAIRPRVDVLNLDVPIPAWVGLLSVASDQRWDRIHPAARLAHPELFAAG